MAIEINPDEEFHVVLGGVVTTLSLNALDAAYQGDAIQDETLIWQQGFDAWMRLDALLQALENQESDQPQAESTIEEDIYYVMAAPEDIKKMSLDLLNDAYRLEVIDEDTLIWQPGYTEWIPLKVLLGSEEPLPHYSLAPSLAPVPPSAYGSQAPSAPSSAYPSQASSVVPSNLYSAPAVSAPSSGFPSQAPSAPSSAYANQPSGAYPGQVPSSGYSLAPMADIPLPAAIPRASPWFGRSLVAISTFAFVFILHKNGATQSLAEGLEKTEDLRSLEAKFGAPTYRTPHELEHWLLEVEETYKLSDLSETEALPGEKKADEPGHEDQEQGDKTASTEESADAAKANPEASDEKSDQEDSSKTNGKASNFGAALSGKKAPPPAVKQPKKQTWTPKKERKAKSSGLAYDPMNGAL